MLQNSLTRITYLTILAILGCSEKMDNESARKQLKGAYDLSVGQTGLQLNSNFLSSELRLHDDGTFTLNCAYKVVSQETVSGRWSVSEGKVQFDRFKDCAGVWPVTNSGAASLLVSFSKPLTIMLSPDLPVYYIKRPT